MYKTKSKNLDMYKNLFAMCIGKSSIRDVWRQQNKIKSNEMLMLCRSCDLNALLIRLGWQPWCHRRPLGGTWRKCGTSVPTENRVGARASCEHRTSELKYAVSWRQARGKSSQTKPSQAKSRQVEATQAKSRQVESASQNHYWPQMPQHTKKARRRRKKELKANPKPTTPHTHTQTDSARHTHSNKCHAYCATDPISRLVFFYTERTARRSSSNGDGIGCGCGCGSHNGFEMLTGSAQPAATAEWEIQRYFARTDPAACSFTAAPDTVRLRATHTHTHRWRWSRSQRPSQSSSGRQR